MNPIDKILGTENSAILIISKEGIDTKEDLVKAWEDGKDFRILYGSYCSIRDIKTIKEGYDHAWLRTLGMGAVQIF